MLKCLKEHHKVGEENGQGKDGNSEEQAKTPAIDDEIPDDMFFGDEPWTSCSSFFLALKLDYSVTFRENMTK